jgi:GMP synthase-like glutamine amidotransferase
MKIKVYSIHGIHDAAWLGNAFEVVNSPSKADVIIYPGGADISPLLYGAKPSKCTWPSEHRDKEEVRIFNENKGKFHIGLCRGAQLLTSLAGGKLVQDVSNHHGYHDIVVDDDGKKDVITTNSIHHQMMYPFDLPEEDYEIIGWTNGLSRHYLMDDDTILKELQCEPEIVYYPKIRAMCFQGHPEMMSVTSKFVQFANYITLKKYGFKL